MPFSSRVVRDRKRPGFADSRGGKSRPDSDWSPQTYLSQVRHLRQRYAGNPVMLQRAVGELSRQRDLHVSAERRKTAAAEPEIVRPAPRDVQTFETSDSQPTRFARAVVDWFANHVARQLDQKLLHFSRRQELLATADRLGIGRFHANLIIAVAQHHVGGHDSPAAATPPKRRNKFWPIAFALVAIQAAIVWGALRVVHG